MILEEKFDFEEKTLKEIDSWIRSRLHDALGGLHLSPIMQHKLSNFVWH